jgi:hypothetical protein
MHVDLGVVGIPTFLYKKKTILESKKLKVLNKDIL